MLAPIAQTELEREVKEVGGSTQATKPEVESNSWAHARGWVMNQARSMNMTPSTS
jgi:hypothetical protein